MTLSDKEYKAFLRTHLDLLYFVGLEQKIITPKTTFDDFVNLDFELKFKCRESLLANDNLLDDYLSLQFDYLTTEQVEILTGFKKKIKSAFIIFKCLKSKAIFIDTKDNKFYAVNALGDPFDVFFNEFPVLVTTTLLPFNDKIIYDGFIQTASVSCGPEFIRTMNEEYKTAKKLNKIETTL